MAWKTREAKRTYQRTWARQYRYQHPERAGGAASNGARRHRNLVGRTQTPVGMKWCPFAQHHVSHSDFNRCRRAKSGLQDYCRACQELRMRLLRHTKAQQR